MNRGPSVWARGTRGAPLVFLHGVGGDHSAWRPQLRHFADDYRCLAWDMPGYGASPSPWEMSFTVLVQSLLELLDEFGCDRIHLVGHSLGGMIAQEFAFRHPDRLRSLALVATSAAFGSVDGDFQRRFIDDRLAPLDAGRTMAQMAPLQLPRMTGPNADPVGVQIAIGCFANVPAASYRAAIKLITAFDRRDALKTIACPTLLVAGEADRVAPATSMQRMAAEVKGAKFVALAGCGHLANLEAPERFNAVLAEFLAGVAAG